jgi:hypothetical protein
MASHTEPKIVALKAGAAIAKGKCVKKGSADTHVAVASAATDKIVGILQTATTAAEDVAEVALCGGGAKALLGGTVVMGDLLTSDADGALVATTTATNRVVAMAMQDGVSGDMIAVEMTAALI